MNYLNKKKQKLINKIKNIYFCQIDFFILFLKFNIIYVKIKINNMYL